MGKIFNVREKNCINCKRLCRYTVKHHLIPAQILRKNDLVNKLKRNTICLCQPCEFYLHYLYSNKKLEKEFNTKNKIISDKRMMTFAKWIFDKPYIKKRQMRKFEPLNFIKNSRVV